MRALFVLREERHAKALYAFLKNNWRAMAEAGEPLAVQIGPERMKRSNDANEYYWGAVLKQISEQAWFNGRTYEAKVWHEVARDKFAPRIDKPFGGSYPMSTSEMRVEQFRDYTKQVEVWAAEELGVRFVEKV